MADPNLLPCPMPYCGSKIVGTSPLPCGDVAISCGGCGMTVPGRDEAQAAERWNSARRAAPIAAQLDAELPPHYGLFNVNGPDGHRIKGWTAEQVQSIVATYAERIRLLDHEAITQKLANQVLRDRVAFLESERNLMEANRRAYIDGRAAAPAAPEARRCKACHSPRQGDTCHKCGDPTFVPHANWEEPALPPVDRIRELAREVGYAIGEHGTKERDLDLIAAPWTEEAIGNHALFEHIAKGLGARIVELERKPLGRYAATLQMDGWYKNIDLSICPFDGRTAGTAPEGYVLVPRKLPPEVVDAIASASYDLDDTAREIIREDWACSLAIINEFAAAPSPQENTK